MKRRIARQNMKIGKISIFQGVDKKRERAKNV